MKLKPEFIPFEQRMRAQGLSEIFIETFKHYYDQLVQGQTGLIPESTIEPVDLLPDSDKLSDEYTAVGNAQLKATAVIKLNGGLGTSMGLQKAKSLLPIRGEYSFLDIIANQVTIAEIPLVLMNSFSTEDDSLAALKKYPDIGKSLPATFVQNKEPKITKSDFTPATWPANPQLEWCPPGHGDIYTALITSGILDELLASDYKYAFVANADNLGAVINAKILGYFAQEGFDFMMEVADRTVMDKKGGHLARQASGNFILRESAQCPPQDSETFEDITRHKYFNTNSLWLNLPALKRAMQARNNMLGLPMIRNEKNVDPRDSGSTAVYQVETAMGSAIAVFENAQALRVPRTRFA
ncbi:MAG: UTP--glucose-1-phosphate uridylyltransferase, partial [Hyphomicrobiales bacterium]|nr:UTP--glucose-1-phosphate uridylyltransferase [Hyphomicrobiales bacterium]